MSPSTIILGPQHIVLRRAALDEILALRHAILRAGLPIETAHFAGDDAPTTLHLGAFHEARNVGCATLHRSQWENGPAWQLRGMATAPDLQRHGIGSALLRFAESAALADSPAIRTFWCNARTSAVPFYRRHGWQVVSDEFVIATAGPHFRMLKRL